MEKSGSARGSKAADEEFRSSLRPAIRQLELRIRELLLEFWEEPLRRQAHECARALLDASKAGGYLELVSILKAIVSLLALPMEEVLTLQKALQAKLKDLMSLLKEVAATIAA